MMPLCACVCAAFVVIPFWGNPPGQHWSWEMCLLLLSHVLSRPALFIFLYLSSSCLLLPPLCLFLSLYWPSPVLLFLVIPRHSPFLLIFPESRQSAARVNAFSCLALATIWSRGFREIAQTNQNTIKKEQKVKHGGWEGGWGGCPRACSASLVHLTCSNIWFKHPELTTCKKVRQPGSQRPAARELKKSGLIVINQQKDPQTPRRAHVHTYCTYYRGGLNAASFSPVYPAVGV